MIAKALAANGASKVYILGRRLPVLEEAARSVGSPAVIPLQCDVASTSDLGAAVARIESDVGYVNLVVCNAGIAGPYGIPSTAAYIYTTCFIFVTLIAPGVLVWAQRYKKYVPIRCSQPCPTDD